jgi:hypothetical protein
MADPSVDVRPARRLFRVLARSRPIRAAVHDAEHAYELERAGESDWTPWLVLAFLVVFYAVVGLLMFGIVEVASHLLASAVVR